MQNIMHVYFVQGGQCNMILNFFNARRDSEVCNQFNLMAVRNCSSVVLNAKMSELHGIFTIMR